jgi:hypothetical protein
MALRKQVAVRATWRIRKVRLSLLVATQTHLALEPPRVSMTGVAALAGLMLRLAM